MLEEGISEKADDFDETDCKEMDEVREARAVFICSKRDGNGPEKAIMKVFMQSVPLFFEKNSCSTYAWGFKLNFFRIPWIGTDLKPVKERTAQASTCGRAESETHALRLLARANSSSTPILLASKFETQAEHMWVPGGSLGFILMTKVPGSYFNSIGDFSLEERKKLRRSFKKAWL